MNKDRENILNIYLAGLEAVKGDNAVYQALMARGDLPACHVVAIGKAAEAMYQGAKRYLDNDINSVFMISKFGHYSAEVLADPQVVALEAAHPVPGESSLLAGQMLLDHLQKLPTGEPCLFLISGGTSSVCEVLGEGWTLEQLQALTQELLSDGYGINEMNAIRQRISSIKGGKLWKYIGERPVWALLISDVEGDAPTSIGSGLLFPPDEDRLPEALAEKWQDRLPVFETPSVPDNFQWEIVASNQIALAAMQVKATELDYKSEIVPRFVSGPAVHAANVCIAELQDTDVDMLLWGGETTVKLPEQPGRGGRNQHFALAVALEIENKPIMMLAAGTDGSDGLSEDAGALVNGKTCTKGRAVDKRPEDSLQRADSGNFLEACGDLIYTGPTGTNVMDVVIGLKQKA
ncbi:MAG: D-glycerate 2-kinase (EC [uncultured Thiotrichaceae bacterium]|uniref:D-glycerate 2-kinase (EC) n=1 Tax=uncultured Thiotrichaceae bacterium TaxID=298394 RepID=A0A6S6TKY0_9GAMM|nr:MAG: D-glycerate 2-kinase (EC [uncultured Thiotrichaceae bacterium]